MSRYSKKKNYTALFWADFKWLVIFFALGGFFGWLTGYLPWGIITGLLVYFCWRLVAMQRFLYWVNKSVTATLPEFSGSLGFVSQQLHDSKQQEKHAHEQMINLARKIRSSLFALQDSVILLDHNDQLEWWNQSAQKTLSLQSKDQGIHIFDLIKDTDFHHYYQESLIQQPANNDGIRLQSWHDKDRYIQCELTPFGNEKLLIMYDVTRLQHLEQIRKDFVANVSHELRTPLTVLMGYIETFADQADIDPKWQRGFSLMEQQTRRMNSIVNDLLLLSRLENEEAVDTGCVDMPRLLMHIFDDAQVYNKGHGHLIDLHIDSQKNIVGSDMYLNSALLNLITNAIKYTPKGGEIEIAWTEVKNGAVFSVSDNGIGIAPEHIERLTERFYRVDSGRSRATGGTGLGLAIVKHVLYQHDATLTVESVENQGSTFKVFFPSERICTDKPCNPTN